MQLPFAVIPLIRFTSDRTRMGNFASGGLVRFLAWTSAVLIVVLNSYLVAASGWNLALLLSVGSALMLLLAWVAFAPLEQPIESSASGEAVAASLGRPVYRRILVPLDHSSLDRAAVAHAAAMARLDGALLHLMHVEEGAISRLYGPLASTREEHIGERYFRDIADTLSKQGLRTEVTIAHGRTPKAEIVRIAREWNADLIVMGAHGHTGLKDLVFGNTIDAVRHNVPVPVLVVGAEPGQ